MQRERVVDIRLRCHRVSAAARRYVSLNRSVTVPQHAHSSARAAVGRLHASGPRDRVAVPLARRRQL